ncbi:MAG: DUF4159 domain-containing protein [Saprospiraceae bacterium]
MFKLKYVCTVLLICVLTMSFRMPTSLKLALVKYNGGGDWYSVVDALQNLAKFCNNNLNMAFDPAYETVEIGSVDIYNYPFLFLTGHGNIVLSNQEAENVRNYLLAGGFLFIDDDYGMDEFVKLAIKKIFPDKALVEIPYEHPIFNQKYKFPNGMPKIHEHNAKPPITYGIILDGRIALLYAAESNISDGWESPDVHKDTEEKRQQSLRMGANIIQYAFGGISGISK